MGDILAVFLSFSDFVTAQPRPIHGAIAAQRFYAPRMTCTPRCRRQHHPRWVVFFPESFSSAAKRFFGQTKAISQNGGFPEKWWYPKMAGLIMEKPTKMDDLGGKPTI